MFNKLKDFFEGEATLQVDKGGEPTDADLQMATGIILLEMAGSDEDYAPEEVKTIFRTMEKQFQMSDTEVLDLLENADKLRQNKGKIDDFVTAINENFSTKQKQLVLAMVWKVVMADGQLDKEEQKFATQMRFRLQLSEEEAKEARDMSHLV